LALLLPPLAPYWGHETGMRVRAILWLLGLVLYITARGVASF
jgi:hypothetical protein